MVKGVDSVMRKQISIVTLDPRAGEFYAGEVAELFGTWADVSVFSVTDGSAMGTLPPADLFAVSSDAYGSAEEVARHVPIGCPVMGIEVSFRWSALRKLKKLPAGTKVLFVNMTMAMAREAIAQLSQLGVNHIDLIPFYPGMELTEEIRIAVTPDEMRYVPAQIETQLDLGHRSCTSGMMIEIALRLGLDSLLETAEFQSYFQSIATSNYSFDQVFARSVRLESQFHILMESLGDGVIGVSETGRIFACNRHAEEITRTTAALILGKRGDEVFPYVPFAQCLQEKSRLPATAVRVNGVNISVEVVPVLRQADCIGAFAILQKFNEVEVRQSELRSQLFHKGHCAKYSLKDVIGQSECILKSKEGLKRMAASESPILLIGETGTGKELFAHAIHRASRRSDRPFVAINVAAFPESLLESELFGYEEGAFTGARKGGRPGLFELAHTGTLFLDEVEGMSPALQVRLLRVLQEKEITRVGGNRIIRIDVRIVAATNESLEDRVDEGSFRRDLYYRLNTLPLVIPPLSQRGEDVFLLMEHFRTALGGDFRLTAPVRDFFQQYTWPGNIRELRNVVEYFIYTDHRDITSEDLPPTVLRHRPTPLAPARQPEGHGDDGASFVLEALYHASEARTTIGRDKLLELARQHHLPLSQQEIRGILAELAQRGLVKVGKGRGGSRITPQGRKLFESGEV